MTVHIYPPDVVGHPCVYCRVIADALEQYEAINLVIALGFAEEVGLNDFPDLWPLEHRDQEKARHAKRK